MCNLICRLFMQISLDKSLHQYASYLGKELHFVDFMTQSWSHCHIFFPYILKALLSGAQ